jgi:hypothetical protein
LTDEFIIYLFLYSTCWKPHFHAKLARLEFPHCQEPDCNGKLYTVKHLSSSAKRTPVLTLPFVRPESAIQWMCLQPGVAQDR